TPERKRPPLLRRPQRIRFGSKASPNSGLLQNIGLPSALLCRTPLCSGLSTSKPLILGYQLRPRLDEVLRLLFPGGSVSAATRSTLRQTSDRTSPRVCIRPTRRQSLS